MSALRQFTAQLLTLENAVVDDGDPEILDVLLPESTRRSLRLPEWCRLGFSRGQPAGVVEVDLTHEWLARFSELLAGRGRYWTAAIADAQAGRFPADGEAIASEHLHFQNATWRYQDAQSGTADYLLLRFKASAQSDEKREELITLCLNEETGAVVPRLVEPLMSGASDLVNPPPSDNGGAGGAAMSPAGVAATVEACLPPLIQETFAPFLKIMERRMTRDLERLYNYYEDLLGEAGKRYREKEAKAAGSEALDKERLKILAIAREYPQKVADVRRRYAMAFDARLVQAMRVKIPVLRLAVRLLRRKGSRTLTLEWNPLTRRLDPLPCAGCRRSEKVALVCDERLHLLCSECLSACGACKKSYCRACHTTACPACRK